MENSGSTFVFACGVERADPVNVTFADGVRAVPGWIVKHYGGREKLLADAEVYAQLNYSDFIASFDEAVEREHLNKEQADVLRRHFRLRIR